MNILFLLNFMACAQIFASNPIFRYEPKKSEIIGTLDRQTFPGPPNYESIATGDAMERHWYVKLDSPIDVVTSDGDNVVNPETEKNIRIIQLSPNSDDETILKFKKTKNGTRIKLKGRLFHRFTGHHHARMLMDVDTMEVL